VTNICTDETISNSLTESSRRDAAVGRVSHRVRAGTGKSYEASILTWNNPYWEK